MHQINLTVPHTLTSQPPSSLQCACCYPITIPAGYRCSTVKFRPRGNGGGCPECQPQAVQQQQQQQEQQQEQQPLQQQAPPVEPHVPLVEQQDPPVEPEALAAACPRTPPPDWWRSQMAAKFAECVFLLGMLPSAWDHHVFESLECKDRFPTTKPAQWLAAIPFLESALEEGGAIRAHFKALKTGAAKVALPPEGAAGSGAGRSKRKRGGPSGGGVFKGVGE